MITWNTLNGQAVEAVHHSKPCDLCKGAPMTDEYGSSWHCYKCGSYGGNGKLRWVTYIRVPEFDAPKPPDKHGQMRIV